MTEDLNTESKPMRTTMPQMALVSLTPSAKDYLESVRQPGHYVTLGVKGGGCSGMTYVWGLQEGTTHEDIRWSDPIDDVLLVDPIAEMHIIGGVIDWINELGGNYLKIINPNATSHCGCGESFSV